MIRIAKGASPRKLLTDGSAHALSHRTEYEADAAAYRAGTRTFSFPRTLYAHKTVRAALERLQHGKCCYCEAKPDKPYAHLHVEHWRPKTRSKQALGEAEHYPGYYWLAYDWENLLLGCHFCNSVNKGDLFPLADPATRAQDHNAELGQERPLLLKPDGPDDLRTHITFHEEVPVGITPEGRATVEVLGLDKTDHTPRLTLLNRLKKCRDTVIRYHGDPTEAAVEFVAYSRGFIESAVRPEAPYSAMAAAFVERNPLPP